MKKQFFTGILVAILFGTILSSCYKKNIEETYPSTGCDTTNVTFSTVIKPIIDSKCATSGCHASGANFPDLSTYVGIQASAADSSLINSITRINNTMPKNNPKLDACTINKIVSWMNHGTPNN